MGRVVISLRATSKAGGKRREDGKRGERVIKREGVVYGKRRDGRGRREEVLSELASWTPEAGRCRRHIIAGR